MAFSGITVAALLCELKHELLNCKINRISQPEPSGLVMLVHTKNGNKRLYISANPSLPLIYLTDENKASPKSAYNFVMVLRKHIANARIVDISQPGLERVICIRLEHLNELKDVAYKNLYLEIMGKHSNIIFTDENNIIIDSIKHIPRSVSSVREVLPGREYFIPGQSNKMDMFKTDETEFFNKVLSRSIPVYKAISSSFVGFSNVTGMELSKRAGIDFDMNLESVHEEDKKRLSKEFIKLKEDIINNNYNPVILYENNKPIEFSAFDLNVYEGVTKEYHDSISKVIQKFYIRKNNDNLIKQKASDLTKLVSNSIERVNKKLAIQNKQLEDTGKMEKYRLFGELLQTCGYGFNENKKSIEVENYYDNNTLIKIPLDETLSLIDNSKVYFKKYDKLKRTKNALIPQIQHSENELKHLSTILASLSLSESEADLSLIRQELFEYGYIKKNPGLSGKKQIAKNPPLHYVSSDGFDLYVGKNNYQNEEVTFKIARGEDWWFHAKNMPGSHVILKTNGKEVPDHMYEIAAGLAAYYSSGRDSTHIEIDYVQRKELKKVPGAAKGYVIYYSNYSMTATPIVDDSLTLL